MSVDVMKRKNKITRTEICLKVIGLVMVAGLVTSTWALALDLPSPKEIDLSQVSAATSWEISTSTTIPANAGMAPAAGGTCPALTGPWVRNTATGEPVYEPAG